jgi:hypothetical protein
VNAVGAATITPATPVSPQPVAERARMLGIIPRVGQGLVMRSKMLAERAEVPDATGTVGEAEAEAVDGDAEPDADDGTKPSARHRTVGEYEKEMVAAADRRRARSADAKAKATAAGSVKKRPAMTAMKRPAAAVWDVGSRPPMPNASDGPVDYGRARIYTSEAKKTFRVICERGNYDTERRSQWGGSKPTLASWAAALSLVEGAMRVPRKKK